MNMQADFFLARAEEKTNHAIVKFKNLEKF